MERGGFFRAHSAAMVGRMRTDLARLAAEYEQTRERLDALRLELTTLSATARSDDRCVTATVGATGRLTGLEFAPALAARLEYPALADRVVEAAERAADLVAQRLGTAVGAALPERLRGLVAPDGAVNLDSLLPRAPR